MADRSELISFLATLLALVIVVVAAAVTAAHGQDKATYLLGNIAVGLIGVLKMPRGNQNNV